MVGYRLTNRDRKRNPVGKGLHWCDTCDAQLVGHGSKCPNCGKWTGRKLNKKQDLIREEDTED